MTWRKVIENLASAVALVGAFSLLAWRPRQGLLLIEDARKYCSETKSVVRMLSGPSVELVSNHKICIVKTEKTIVLLWFNISPYILTYCEAPFTYSCIATMLDFKPMYKIYV